jgi:hypothetical protein
VCVLCAVVLLGLTPACVELTPWVEDDGVAAFFTWPGEDFGAGCAGWAAG